MSEFFKNYDTEEEQKKPTKVFQESSEEEEDKTPNKEKKTQELQEEVNKLKNYNNKNIDNLLKNMKKYKNAIKDGLPAFLTSFFEKILADKKISQNIKNKIKKFIGQYEQEIEAEVVEIQEEREVIETIDNEKIENDFNNMIIEICMNKDLKIQEEKLMDLYNKRSIENEKCKVALSLLNLYFKMRIDDFMKIKRIFDDICIYIKNDARFMGISFKEIITNNIELYFNNIFQILKKEFYNDFNDLLRNIKFIDEKKVYKKELEFNYFYLNNTVETEDEMFKLLFLIRKNEYKEAEKYYESIDNSKIDIRILNELGLLAFKNDNYLFSFKLLEKCYFAGCKENQKILFALCVLIEEQIVNEKFYDVFIENIRILENNKFLYETEDTLAEIYRSYYFLNNYDYETSSQILERVFENNKFKDILEERVKKMIY